MEGGIPFRTPFCLVSFPSHVRHRVYNSFLVTLMGLRYGLRLSQGSTSREVHALTLERVERNIPSEIHMARISWRINIYQCTSLDF